MKLNRTLTINHQQRELISERIVLDIDTPGRAQFELVKDNHDIKTRQLVTYDFGYTSNKNLTRWFIGYIDKVVPVSHTKTHVFCRELCAVLHQNLPLNLRHVTLRDVIEHIKKITGLSFALPDAPYVDTKIANFYHLGSGYAALDAMAEAFQINDYIWQQQAGIIYVGSWADSRWANLSEFGVPDNLLDNHSANETARIMALPQLRPGMQLNGFRIGNIDFSNNHMTLSWGEQ